CGQYDSDPYSF
nr:immunoglobulin light chain junction region [Macaca mulatta]